MANEGGTKQKLLRKSQTFNVTDRLYAARVRQLYKQSHIGIIASLANSIILIALLWGLVPHSASIIWVSVMLLITALRCALFYRYRRSSLTPANAGGFSTGFIIGASLYGMVWGSSGIDEEKKRLIKGYLTKPIEMARLSEELAQVLG